MTGIVGVHQSVEDARKGLNALGHRGSYAHTIATAGDYTIGTATESEDFRLSSWSSPLHSVDVAYDGALWNRPKVAAMLRARGYGYLGSDGEVIAAALHCWGVQALNELEGAYALIWTDGSRIYGARDRFGEVPLHYLPHPQIGSPDFALASELKGLQVMGGFHAEMVPPGAWVSYEGGFVSEARYYRPPLVSLPDSRQDAAAIVRDFLAQSVYERIPADGGPVSVLLSGGIDSSAVAALLVESGAVDVTAYTAVYDPASPDLKSARQVAEHLGLELREVKVPTPTLEDLRHTIATIELPYKAQVEIGWACVALARQMAADGVTVTFSGEGSDELWASHAFSYYEMQRPGSAGWHEYRAKDFEEQAYRNFARENKVFAAHGIEVRLPFLHRMLVPYILSLSEETCRDNTWTAKVPLTMAFSDCLPSRPLTKQKLGFQDGLGIKADLAALIPENYADARSWYRAVYRGLFGREVQ